MLKTDLFYKKLTLIKIIRKLSDGIGNPPIIEGLLKDVVLKIIFLQKFLLTFLNNIINIKNFHFEVEK